MKKKIVLSILSLFICTNICAMKKQQKKATKKGLTQKETKKILKKAQKLFKQDKLQKAIEILSPIMESHEYLDKEKHYEAKYILAKIYRKQGKQKHYLKLVDNLLSQNTHILYNVKTINDIAYHTSCNLKQYAKAIKIYQQALTIIEKKKLNNPEIQTEKYKGISGIAFSYLYLEEYKKAIEIFQELLIIMRQNKANNPEIEIGIYGATWEVANGLKQHEQHENAKEICQTLLTMMEQNKSNDSKVQTTKYGTILNILELYRKFGNYEEAARLVFKLLNASESSPEMLNKLEYIKAQANFAIARIKKTQKNSLESKKYYKKAKKNLEQCLKNTKKENRESQSISFCAKVVLSDKNITKRKKQRLNIVKNLMDPEKHNYSEKQKEIIKNVHPDLICPVCKIIQKNMKKCSRCRNTYYCSRECQTKDWKEHKKVCKKKDKQ